MDLKLDLFTDEQNNKCKGLWFRVRRSTFINKRKEIVATCRLYLLKKRSCNPDECDHCGITYYQLPEYLETDSVQFDNMYDGDLYTITWINMGRGFEDLYDEYEMRFTRVNETKNN